MKISLVTSLLFCLLPFLSRPGLAVEESGGQDVRVAPGVSARLVEADLPSRKAHYLDQLMQNPAKRLDYVKKLYTDRRLEELIAERGLDRSQPLLAALRAARQRLLLDGLVGQELEKMEPDLEALAQERYKAHRDRYQVRKKIRLAIIFIGKAPGREAEARSEMKQLKARLDKEPDNWDLFQDLAKEHSQDKWAQEGGVNDKWLIAPLDLDKSPPMVRAAFALDTPGELTDIVETERGFAIAKLMDVTPAVQLGFEKAKDGILRSIRAELRRRKQDELLESLQAPADLAVTDDAALKTMIAEEQESRSADQGETGGEDSNR